MKWLGSSAFILAALAIAPPCRAEGDRRTNSIAITSFCYGLAMPLAMLYYGFDQPGARPLWWAHAGLTPSIPRLAMHDWLGATLFSVARMSSLLLAERWRNLEDKTGRGPMGDGFILFGYALPIAAGIIDLATTPHQGAPNKPDAKPRPFIDLSLDRSSVFVALTFSR